MACAACVPLAAELIQLSDTNWYEKFSILKGGAEGFCAGLLPEKAHHADGRRDLEAQGMLYRLGWLLGLPLHSLPVFYLPAHLHAHKPIRDCCPRFFAPRLPAASRSPPRIGTLLPSLLLHGHSLSASAARIS
jgi:hypothetical protein